MDLSVVVPAFDEARSIEPLYQRLRDALEPLALDWELIVVDDGSRDETFAVLTALHGRDARVQGLRLSRNFGHQLALLAGLREARGRAVVTMDADLQHPPEVVPELVARWRAGAAIVNTVRDDATSDLPFLKRFTSKLFYRIFRLLSGLDLRPGMADFRLFDRQVLEVLLAGSDHRPFFRGFAAWVGFPQADVPFRAGKRLHGASRYTMGKMLRLALSGVVGFSATPLYWSLALGLMGLALSVGFGIYALIVHFWLHSTLQGWTSVVVLMSSLMSLQFVILGILGMYIGEVSQAVRGRPSVVVARSTRELERDPAARPSSAR
jgi:dolichol-phosphate mannosyltransferase